MPIDVEQFRNSLKKSLKENDDAFNGYYGKELKSLLALSEDQINSITPDTTDAKTYKDLITVVETASRLNLNQSELIDHIKTMGDVAVRIAKLAGIIV